MLPRTITKKRPSAALMRALVSYLQDDSVQTTLLTILAGAVFGLAALNRFNQL